MSRTGEEECTCDEEITNSKSIEFIIIDSRIELRCHKCNGIISWWHESTEKIRPFRLTWSKEERFAMR
jgi:hypothetical protein